MEALEHCNCLDLDEVSYRAVQDDDMEFVLHALIDGTKGLMDPKRIDGTRNKTFSKQVRIEFNTHHFRAKRPDYAIIAMHDGRRIGFVWATMEVPFVNGDKRVLLRNVYILPELCGQGVAKAMIRMAEEWAAEQGAIEILRDIWSKNMKAKDLYKFLEYKPQTIQVSKNLGKRK